MWDQRYSEEGYAYGTAPNQFLAEEAGRIPEGGRVLCIASGEGRNAVWLAEQGLEVLAVDQSEVGLEKTRGLAADRGVTVQTKQVTFPDFEWPRETYQCITSVFAHMRPPIRREVHRGVVRSLAPGGVFILEAYSPAQVGRGTGGAPIEEMMMSDASLRQELSGLHFELVREVERPVVEGKYHTGNAAVVQLVALKA